VQTPEFRVQTDFLPTHRSAASRPIGAWGDGVLFSHYLGFAPQTVTIRASGTQMRSLQSFRFGLVGVAIIGAFGSGATTGKTGSYNAKIKRSILADRP
jgi:hypothetical protein